LLKPRKLSCTPGDTQKQAFYAGRNAIFHYRVKPPGYTPQSLPASKRENTVESQTFYGAPNEQHTQKG